MLKIEKYKVRNSPVKNPAKNPGARKCFSFHWRLSKWELNHFIYKPLLWTIPNNFSSSWWNSWGAFVLFSEFKGSMIFPNLNMNLTGSVYCWISLPIQVTYNISYDVNEIMIQSMDIYHFYCNYCFPFSANQIHLQLKALLGKALLVLFNFYCAGVFLFFFPYVSMRLMLDGLVILQ